VADIERLQRAVGRYAIAFALASPLWLLLLLTLPRMGLGVGLSLFFSSAIASAAALAGHRWFVRNAGLRDAAGGEKRRAWTLTPAMRRTMLVCAAVIVLYVVLVTRAGG